RCASSTCPGDPQGSALLAYAQGQLTANGFVLERGPLCGLHLSFAEVDLSRGQVQDFAVGVCLEAPGYDLDRLDDEVSFSGNSADLRTSRLPLPDPLEPASVGGL